MSMTPNPNHYVAINGVMDFLNNNAKGLVIGFVAGVIGTLMFGPTKERVRIERVEIEKPVRVEVPVYVPQPAPPTTAAVPAPPVTATVPPVNRCPQFGGYRLYDPSNPSLGCTRD